MADPVRVMLEHGTKKRVVACAFDWPGWDRSVRVGADVLAVLAAYRPRYARVAGWRASAPSSQPRASSRWSRSSKGGGWEKDRIIRHVNGAEIDEFAPKVGVKVPLETRDNPQALRAYRDGVVEGIREHHARGEPARSWPLQFLIRRCAWNMLDHGWELEDRDLTTALA